MIKKSKAQNHRDKGVEYLDKSIMEFTKMVTESDTEDYNLYFFSERIAELLKVRGQFK